MNVRPLTIGVFRETALAVKSVFAGHCDIFVKCHNDRGYVSDDSLCEG